jgi:SAM-dependent methyltransferase
MDIELLQKLTEKPRLYEKGSSVMWTDPYISKQLLSLHINSDLDIASRSKAKIEAISGWILEQVGKPNLKILDLGCGPGLYDEIFALKGHSVTGVDFSENSIRYATQQAKAKGLNITYVQKNYLDLDYEEEFDLVIMIYMDFCVLIPAERTRVLHNIHKALKKDGLFICDVVNDRNIDKKILPQSWEVSSGGFWKGTPYVALSNGYLYPEAKVFANHHIIIGEEGNKMDTYIFWNHYYGKNDLVPIFESAGFAGVKNFENVLPESNDYWNGENVTFYSARVGKPTC